MTPEDAAFVSAIAALVSAFAALASLAALGASVYFQWRSGRPRLKLNGTLVTLYSANWQQMGETSFGIDIRNVGAVPVTIQSVGITTARVKRGALPSAQAPDGTRLPHRLEPQTSITLTNPLGPIQDEHAAHPVTAVWVRTATSEHSSKELPNLARGPGA